MKLRECLGMQPPELVQGFANNNLAVAAWWHKFPNFRNLGTEDDDDTWEGDGKTAGVNGEPAQTTTLFETPEQDYPIEQIDLDYENAIPLFKNAISHFERVDVINDPVQRQLVETLLDRETTMPAEVQKFVRASVAGVIIVCTRIQLRSSYSHQSIRVFHC
jgi:hypothetical protein